MSGPGSEKYTTSSEGGITPASVIAVGAVLPGLASIAVAMRFFARRYKVAPLGADDALIIVALILTLGLGVMMIVGGAMPGLAQPTPQGNAPKAYLTTTNDAEILTEKLFWAFDLVQCLAFGAVKLSVLYFYRRLFTGRTFHIVSYSMIAIVIVWSLGFFFAILFRCGTQFWALWAPLIYLLQNCYNSTPMFLAFTSSDVITDVLILVIPVYWVMRLNMTLAKRLGVCGVFLLGLVAVAAGCARLAIFVKQTKDPYLNADGIGHLTTEIYWSMIEMGISVIAACLPTMRPLFATIPTERLRSFFTSLTSRGSRSQLPVTSDPRSKSTRRRHDEGEESNSESVRMESLQPKLYANETV